MLHTYRMNVTGVLQRVGQIGGQGQATLKCFTKITQKWMILYRKSDTNAVERKNRDSKDSTPNSLRSAIIILYELDKSECAKHLAASSGVSLSYRDRSHEARKSAAIKRITQRAQKHNDDTAEHGPPDRQCHFEN